MALTREQKQKIIADLKEKIEKQKIIVFADFTGLKVKDLSELRKRIKAADSEIKVIKKTLLNIAFEKGGLKIDVKKLKGEIAVTFGYKDEISTAKTVYQFSLENQNLKILGGYFQGEFREADEIVTLAQLSSKKELLSNLVRSISGPISNFVNVLQGNIKGLIYVLTKIKT